MNPVFIYQKIEKLFEGFIDLRPLRFATDPSDLPESGYIVCAVSLQAADELEKNYTADATIEFSLVIPCDEEIDRRVTEDAFSITLDELYTNLSAEGLNEAKSFDEETGLADELVHFYKVLPESVPAPEYDGARLIQRVTFKATVQF